MDFVVRKAVREDLPALLSLYEHFEDNVIPPLGERSEAIWERILGNPNHHVLIGFAGGVPASTCSIVVIDNLTRDGRSIGLVENVVTDARFRGAGCATRVLDAARDIAAEAGCYKIMLLTSSKEDSVLGFYRRAGYNAEDKTGFIQWL